MGYLGGKGNLQCRKTTTRVGPVPIPNIPLAWQYEGHWDTFKMGVSPDGKYVYVAGRTKSATVMGVANPNSTSDYSIYYAKLRRTGLSKTPIVVGCYFYADQTIILHDIIATNEYLYILRSTTLNSNTAYFFLDQVNDIGEVIDNANVYANVNAYVNGAHDGFLTRDSVNIYIAGFIWYRFGGTSDFYGENFIGRVSQTNLHSGDSKVIEKAVWEYNTVTGINVVDSEHVYVSAVLYDSGAWRSSVWACDISNAMTANWVYNRTSYLGADAWSLAGVIDSSSKILLSHGDNINTTYRVFKSDVDDMSIDPEWTNIYTNPYADTGTTLLHSDVILGFLASGYSGSSIVDVIPVFTDGQANANTNGTVVLTQGNDAGNQWNYNEYKAGWAFQHRHDRVSTYDDQYTWLAGKDDSTSVLPCWFVIDLGSGNSATPTQYAMCPSSYGPLSTWVFQGSNDSTNWTTLDTQTDFVFTAGNRTLTYFNFANTTAFRYFRLYVTESIDGIYAALREFRLFYSTGGYITPNAGLYDGILTSINPSTGVDVYKKQYGISAKSLIFRKIKTIKANALVGFETTGSFAKTISVDGHDAGIVEFVPSSGIVADQIDENVIITTV